MKLLLAFIFLVFSLTSFGAMACSCKGRAMYVGNPERVNTIWKPGKCDKNGVWHDGYYVHFQKPVMKNQLKWIEGAYDTCGNWVKGHWCYKAVNKAVKICKKECHCHRH